MSYWSLMKLAIEAALKAGEEILKIYETDFAVQIKEDATPVTLADKSASRSIVQSLSPSGIHVVSEEESFPPYDVRKNWRQVWIVDPLDGTKEFVKRNGEFTVNIALVEDQHPVIGVIYSPVSRILYFAAVNEGSFKVEGRDVIEHAANGMEELLLRAQKLPLQTQPAPYTVVASRSHLSREVSERIRRARLEHSKVEIINTGSSIKFCWIAEGLAHEYPRFGTTMEWDTAAGQCIIEQTGGKVIDLSTNRAIVYNREDLKNNSFIAYCKN